ncbi:IDEAL domain-containing protein [Priestia megaterium]|nr:IDEAL domain-containing protein [Priestia megaterium]
MKIFNNKPLTIGDWVKGKSRYGELIYGYVSSIDSIKEKAIVNVVECDDKQLIGKNIGMLNTQLKKRSNSKQTTEEQLLYLINLALTTKDEQWFNELSQELNEIRNFSKKAKRGEGVQ